MEVTNGNEEIPIQVIRYERNRNTQAETDNHPEQEGQAQIVENIEKKSQTKKWTILASIATVSIVVIVAIVIVVTLNKKYIIDLFDLVMTVKPFKNIYQYPRLILLFFPHKKCSCYRIIVEKM